MDYRERSSAANKIRMNFFRREFGAIGGNDVLVSRFIGRYDIVFHTFSFVYLTCLQCNNVVLCKARLVDQNRLLFV